MKRARDKDEKKERKQKQIKMHLCSHCNLMRTKCFLKRGCCFWINYRISHVIIFGRMVSCGYKGQYKKGAILSTCMEGGRVSQCTGGLHLLTVDPGGAAHNKGQSVNAAEQATTTQQGTACCRPLAFTRSHGRVEVL